ncbi:hypothetical protein LguiA_035218 [Lonicera macranthoides]
MSTVRKAWIVAASVGLVEALKDQGFCRWNYTIRAIHHHTKSNLRSLSQTKRLSSRASIGAGDEAAKQPEESFRKVMYLSFLRLIDSVPSASRSFNKFSRQ